MLVNQKNYIYCMMKAIQKSSAANLKVVFDYFGPGTFAAKLNINFFSAMVLDNNNGTGQQLHLNCICLWMFLKKKVNYGFCRGG